MLVHLSSEQFSECVLGQQSAIVAQHILDCPACTAELAKFRESLGHFRGAVRSWSEEQATMVLAVPSSLPEPSSRRTLPQFAWALLIAAVCILASFVVPRHSAEKAAPSDSVLLNQVDTEVSRTVPSSMEPLMKLVVQNQ